MDSNKTLSIPIESMSKKTKKVITEKPRKHRIVTQTAKWSDISDNLVENEGNGLIVLLNKDGADDTCAASRSVSEAEVEQPEQKCSDASKMIAQHIRTKICGYAAQDREKGLFSDSEFVKYQDVLDLFKTSELNCYYCKGKTMTLYEYVREPKQWTLERLDNSRGHNRDNVVLACLQCNLRRRTMASERYVKTKEMSKIVKVE